MQYNKNGWDEKRERYDLRYNPVMLFLKNRDAIKFNIGDILIRKILGRHDGNAAWVEEKVSNSSSVPKRFVYAFENELGVGYVRQLSADGSKMTSNLICLANIDFHRTKYEVDPLYLDSVILGVDPIERIKKQHEDYRKNRQRILKYNKSITLTGQAKKEWMDNLKVGDPIWLGMDNKDLANSYDYFVLDIKRNTNLQISVGLSDGTNRRTLYPSAYKVSNVKPMRFED